MLGSNPAARSPIYRICAPAVDDDDDDDDDAKRRAYSSCQGSIVTEEGTHDELMAKPDGLYRKLVQLQNNKMKE